MVLDPRERISGELPALFPWCDVDARGECWNAYDKKGDPVRVGQGRTRLRFDSRSEQLVAWRAQRRWFRNHRDEVGWFAVERLESVRTLGWVMLVHMAVALGLGAYLMAPFVRSYGDEVWTHLSSRAQAGFVVLALAVLGLTLLVLYLDTTLVRLCWSSTDWRKLQLDSDGVTASRFDGSNSRFEWRDMCQVVQRFRWTRLEFRGGGDIFLHPQSARRSLLIAAEIERAVLPNSSVLGQNSSAPDLRRSAAVWSGVGLTFAAACVCLLEESMLPWTAITFGAGSAVGGFALSQAVRISAALERRGFFRRARRKGSRRQSFLVHHLANRQP